MLLLLLARLTNRAYTMTARNHDSRKVYYDGHSNGNVKNQRHTFKKSPNSQRIYGHVLSSENRLVTVVVVAVMVIVCGRDGLWPSSSNPV